MAREGARAWEGASAGKGAATWGRTETSEGEELERDRDLGGGRSREGTIKRQEHGRGLKAGAWEWEGAGAREGVEAWDGTG